ncbi:condensation domain-containing protein [Streptomyces sp. NBC_00118]|uniref:condensation domain-containing protein n=1 Tax=unclassified Streptomyces TaxID=2593676 RepID=UPI003091509D|nr:condensation domain-containing protein [Streptomyces sp. NBC_01397]
MGTIEEGAALAVVGAAFEFPQCADWDTLTALLREGRDAMRGLPQKRAESTGVVRTASDREGGWIDDVTGFDHRYFGISKADAELTDPRQRRMLQLAVRAIGEAGYAPGELAGSDTAVLVAGYGAPHPSLYNLLPAGQQGAGPAMTGSLHAYAAGRVAYHLDLRGPAEVIDTSCSSFLVALHEARWKLARGECDLALVGGFELVLGPLPRRTTGTDGLGVLSAEDRCRPFDSAADGTTYGEGGGFVLVKRYEDAVRDGDTICAVVRGSAVNQDAGRSTGLTAPSPAAQSEVITAAWQDAGVDPATIGYVEAHGTATKIGDPIEIQGLAGAFAAARDATGARPVSSVKGNLGHLGSMASFAGLMRVIAQFRAGEIFPTAHFREANPLLALPAETLRIAAGAEPWPTGRGPRRAGISSFGLSGTNAHMVVEEGPATPPPPPYTKAERPFVLSARDLSGLDRQVRRLRDLIAADVTGFDLAAAGEVLTAAREHFPLRHAWTARDTTELLGRLDAVLHGPGQAPVPGTTPPLVVALGDTVATTVEDLRACAAGHPAFADVHEEAARALPAGEWNAAQRTLVRLVGGHAMLARAGLAPALVLAHGVGAHAARVLRGETDLATALGALGDPPAESAPPNPEALRGALSGLAGHPLVVDLAPGGALSGLLAAQPVTAVATTPVQALALAFAHGHTVDWRAALGRPPVRRVPLPVAALAEEHCWPAMAAVQDAPDAPEPETAEPETAAGGSVTDIVLGFARDVLKEPGLGEDDDFFDAGGNSLNGTQLVARINERFGTDFEVLDLFDLPDLRSLADAVAGAAPQAATPRPAGGQEEGTARGAGGGDVREGPLCGQQTAIWAAQQLDPESGAYNVPAALLLDGEPDPRALAARLTTLVRRHPMLRAFVRDTPEGPVQCVAPADGAEAVLEHIESDLSDHTLSSGEGALLERLRALVAAPLSPYSRPAARHQLIRVRFADGERHVLLLTYHHLFVDGWSWRLLFEDLAGTAPESPEPGRHYLDHVTEQRERLGQETGRTLEAFWSGYLSGSRPAPLPEDPADAAAPGAAVLELPVAPRLAERLRELARRERATSNMVFLAAWAALLWRITGETDVTVAVPAAGRAPADEPVVGNYANTLVLRVRVRPDEPFSALLAAVREASLATLAHQDLPTDRIRRTARPGSAEPLAATMFGFNSGVAPLRRIGPDGPAVELLDVGQGAPAFPVSVAVLEYGEETRAGVQYTPDRFRATTVEGWLDAYRSLLESVAEQGTGARTADLAGGPAPVRATDVTGAGEAGEAEETADEADGAGHVAPRTPVERELAALWAQFLKRDRVGVTDDFFDLGGDSITAIAIASEAARRGLALRPRTVLELRTVAAAATRTTRAEPAPARPDHVAALAAADTPDENEPVELTPPQLEFLARGAARPDHWNHGVLYRARRPLDAAEVGRALRTLARRHPVLRARLREDEGLWRQSAGPEAPPVTEFDLRGADAGRIAETVDARATELHESLDLREGPVCRAGLFRLPAGLPDELVLVVHHVVVDLYSWNVLTEELSALLRDGDDRALAPAGPSYFHWARRLARHVAERPDDFDGSYWLDHTWGDGAQRASVPEGPRGVEGNTQELVTDLPVPDTAGQGVTLYERLLAALGAAFQDWLGVRGGEVAVQLVGHGREDLFSEGAPAGADAGVDLGRTVGYFNSTYPFALALPGRRAAADHTAYVARELRSVPQAGFGFEALRHHHPDPGARRALGAIEVPGVLFSFWGRPAFLDAGQAGDEDGVLTGVRTELVGRDRPFDMERPCPVEVYPSLTDGRLTVRWRFSGELFTAARIQDLANAFGAALGT